MHKLPILIGPCNCLEEEFSPVIWKLFSEIFVNLFNGF